MNQVEFKSVPKPGTTIALDEQRYELLGTEPCVRKDGSPTHLLVWGTDCPRCGAMFMASTGLVSKSLPRRCPSCRVRARRPVSGQKRQVGVQVKVSHP